MKSLWFIPLLCSLATAQGIGGKAGIGGLSGIGGGPSAAGIAIVQGCGRNQSTSATTAVWLASCSQSLSVGNWLVAVGDGSNTASLACTDTLGNTFTNVSATGITPELFYCYAPITTGGADSITITTSSNNGGSNFSLELSGVGGFDAAGTASSALAGTTWTMPSVTTTQANDIVISFGGNASTNNTSFVAGSGYTIPPGTCGSNVSAACGIGSGGNQSGFVEYQIVTTATTYTPSVTLTTMTGGGNTISFHP